MLRGISRSEVFNILNGISCSICTCRLQIRFPESELLYLPSIDICTALQYLVKTVISVFIVYSATWERPSAKTFVKPMCT